MKLAKRLKKEKVNVDVVNFGEEVCTIWGTEKIAPFLPGTIFSYSPSHKSKPTSAIYGATQIFWGKKVDHYHTLDTDKMS